MSGGGATMARRGWGQDVHVCTCITTYKYYLFHMWSKPCDSPLLDCWAPRGPSSFCLSLFLLSFFLRMWCLQLHVHVCIIMSRITVMVCIAKSTQVLYSDYNYVVLASYAMQDMTIMFICTMQHITVLTMNNLCFAPILNTGTGPGLLDAWHGGDHL